FAARKCTRAARNAEEQEPEGDPRRHGQSIAWYKRAHARAARGRSHRRIRGTRALAIGPVLQGTRRRGGVNLRTRADALFGRLPPRASPDDSAAERGRHRRKWLLSAPSFSGRDRQVTHYAVGGSTNFSSPCAPTRMTPRASRPSRSASPWDQLILV